MLRALLFAVAVAIAIVQNALFCGAANILPPPPGPADPGFNRLRGYETVIPGSAAASTWLSTGLESGIGNGSRGGGESKIEEAARADKAEIAGILKIVSSDEDGNDFDQSFMVVVNEYAGREIVRQSVGYQTLRKIPAGKVVFYMVSHHPFTLIN